MGLVVCMGALMTCSFGVTPSPLIVIRPKILAGVMPMANIMDNKPIVNIVSFGMCNSAINPATKRPPPVFFTPAPCVPVIPAPWLPGSPKVMVENLPALDQNCKLMCSYGGVIQFVSPGQVKVVI